MQGLSAFWQNALVDSLLRMTSAPAFPSSAWIALLVSPAINTDTGTTIAPGGGGSGQEPSAVDYARLSYGVGNTIWTNTQNSGTGPSTGSSATTMNVNAITFPVATNNWGTIVGVAIVDNSSAGNIIAYGDLTSPVTINVGDQFTFAINALQVILQCP